MNPPANSSLWLSFMRLKCQRSLALSQKENDLTHTLTHARSCVCQLFLCALIPKVPPFAAIIPQMAQHRMHHLQVPRKQASSTAMYVIRVQPNLWMQGKQEDFLHFFLSQLSSKFPIRLTCMFMEWGRKPENTERSLADTHANSTNKVVCLIFYYMQNSS